MMPASFHIDQIDAEQFYSPVTVDSNRGHNFLHVVGRLREGATLRQAATDLAPIADRLAHLYPRTNTGVSTNLMRLPDALARPIKPGLFTMLGVVAIVLLIACANVSGLMLARGATRQRELAIRVALGAGKSRLARQLLTESVLIALLGGGLGLIAAGWTSRALAAVMAAQFHLPWFLPEEFFEKFSFAAPDLNEALRDAGRSATGARGPRVRHGLVIGEIALALVLLAGAGLLMRTLLAMRATHPGFDTRNLLMADLWLPPERFARLQDRAPFVADTLSRLRRLPGVTAAAFVADLPLNGRTNTESFHIVGRPDPSPGRAFNAGFNIATGGYFRMMGTPIRDGREFVDTDGPGTPGVAIVNETAARTLWPDRSPVGQQISLPIDHMQKSVLLTIVGVAADVRHVNLAVPPRPEIFVHSMQSDLNWPWLVLAMRVASAPGGLADPVRAMLREVNPNVPIRRINSADEVVARSITEPRLYTFLLGAFALLAVALAAIGLYGLISYSVSQRSHEIGIRVALGASRADIFRLVLAQGVALAAAGSVIGLACGLAATRALVGLIKGVRPNDPVTLIVVTGLLLGVALLASYVPARRAARVDPAVALRAE